MNKTYRTLSLIVLSSTLILSATENLQQDTPLNVSFYAQTTTQLQQAWNNKWVKVGTASTACAILYAIGIHYNIVPAPSLSKLSLLALPVIAKKTIDAQELPQDSKSDDVTITTTENTQEKEAVETVTPSNNEESKENNTVSIKTNRFPSRNEFREATDKFKKWLINGVHNYTPHQEDCQ